MKLAGDAVVMEHFGRLNNMEKPKFCVDCRWHLSKEFEHGVGHACTHQVSIDSKGAKGTRDPVTGKEIDLFDRVRMCGTMRELNMCGPDAKLWEAKS